ncbi:MAG: DUF5666 domain-containing protein [Minisyncoccota bacterium]
MKKHLVLTAIVALGIGLGIGYVGGHASAPMVGYGTSGGGSGGSTRIPRGRNQSAGGFLTGIVARKDSESITVTTRDGNSHVILFTPATRVFKSVAGSLTDVAVGSTVIVSGSTNSDGSVSASSIQLRRTNAPATIGG